MALSNFNTRIFSSLKHLSFFKTKLGTYKSSFTLHFFKTISGVYSKNNGEGHVKKSFLVIAGLLFRFLTLPSDSGLRFL